MNKQGATKLYNLVVDTWFKHHSKRPKGNGLNCHAWATALHTVLNSPDIRLVHGHFSMNEHSWLEIDYTHRKKERTAIIDAFSCHTGKNFAYNEAREKIGWLYNPRHTEYKVKKRTLAKAIKFLEQGPKDD